MSCCKDKVCQNCDCEETCQKSQCTCYDEVDESSSPGFISKLRDILGL